MKTILRYRTSCMMVLAAIIFISFPPAKLFSQQLELRYSSGTGSFLTFSQWKGYSLVWSQKLKSGSKFGLSFDYGSNKNPYSWVYGVNDFRENIQKTYVENRFPDNRRYAATLFFGWSPLKNDKAAIYLGPTMSLNWLKCKELTHRYANEWFEDAIYYNISVKKKRLGVGLFLEFEMRQFIFERLSASIRLHSENIGYNRNAYWDRSAPGSITLFGADLGLKWEFGKKSRIPDPNHKCP